MPWSHDRSTHKDMHADTHKGYTREHLLSEAERRSVKCTLLLSLPSLETVPYCVHSPFLVSLENHTRGNLRTERDLANLSSRTYTSDGVGAYKMRKIRNSEGLLVSQASTRGESANRETGVKQILERVPHRTTRRQDVPTSLQPSLLQLSVHEEEALHKQPRPSGCRKGSKKPTSSMRKYST